MTKYHSTDKKDFVVHYLLIKTQRSMVIQTDKGEVSLEEGDIIQIKLKVDIHLQPADMKEFNAAKRELIGNQLHSVLLIAGAGSTISKEVLEMMCKLETLGNNRAKAVVVNSLAQNFITNFFKLSNISNTPMMAFSSKTKALHWLKELASK